MTNFPDRETQRPGYDYSDINTGGSAPMWILGAIVVLVILGMVWYGASGPARVGPAPRAVQRSVQRLNEKRDLRPPSATAKRSCAIVSD